MTMRLIHFGIALALATASFAETIILKNGRVINGTYLGGSPRQVKVEAGDQITTLDVGDIARIEFSGGASMPSSRVDDGRPSRRRADGDSSGGRPTLRRADNAAPQSQDDTDRPVVRRAEGN